MGERREEMVKDMGGEGLQEGDFAGLGRFKWSCWKRGEDLTDSPPSWVHPGRGRL